MPAMTYRKLALALPFALLLVACGEKAMTVIDAAVDAAIDAATDGGDASAQGPTEMVVTCNQTATRTIDFGGGTVSVQRVHYADVTVADPRAWLVVQCGRIGQSRNACSAGTCTGALPEYPDCSNYPAQYTGSAVHVECQVDVGASVGTLAPSSGFTSVKLVRF